MSAWHVLRVTPQCQDSAPASVNTVSFAGSEPCNSAFGFAHSILLCSKAKDFQPFSPSMPSAIITLFLLLWQKQDVAAEVQKTNKEIQEATSCCFTVAAILRILRILELDGIRRIKKTFHPAPWMTMTRQGYPGAISVLWTIKCQSQDKILLPEDVPLGAWIFTIPYPH